MSFFQNGKLYYEIMNSKSLFIGTLLVAWSFTACSPSEYRLSKSDKTKVLMSYNVRNGKGMDGKRNIERTAAVIRQAGADVVAIQELDSVTRRSGGVDVLAELAKHTRMYHVFAPAIPYGGGKYGIGILSKQRPLAYRYYSLPGREERRAILVADFSEYRFCCTHLSLTAADRLLSLDIIRQLAETSEKTFIIAGDLNATYDSEFIHQLQLDFDIISNTEGFSYPANQPTELIDYIAVYGKGNKRVKVKEKLILNEPASSDHRPLVSKIRLQ